MTVRKTLCLNMIVKNEMANLERCLAAVAPHIACWVIGDTGSSDGTQDFIRSFFAARDIPGELHSFPFIDFEQARNAALDRAYTSPLAFDYLLLADADMELVVDDGEFRARLEGPCYDLLQRSSVSYWNPRIVRRDAGARYRGVTHEFLGIPGGGSRRLHGLSYKDHASGSNRVDKLERDIRLLLAGLEREPDNHRYWFYLAQSYKDAHRFAEAASAYAKRAAMGGWQEEAWYARLCEARCLRELKDEAGFVRQALAAFNQRPQRAEPLYDLARFHRERGLHDASALFAEAGLALKPPEGDSLFIEDFVYQIGLKEEYSIAANYSSDAARKDRGFAACNWLSLYRDAPERSRGLARHNLRFYVEPAAGLMPSFAARPVDFGAPQGWHATSPSVGREGDQIVLVLRTAKAKSGDSLAGNDAPFETRHHLLRLSDTLTTQSAEEIQPPSDLPAPARDEVRGLDIMRPFARQGALWCSATLRQPTPDGRCRQALARLDHDEAGVRRLSSWRVLDPFGPRPHEQDWIPLVADEAPQFLYCGDPTRIVDQRGRAVIDLTPDIATDDFHGCTQAVGFGEGRVALIHETPGKSRLFFHRFVWFDAAGVLCGVSRPFCFRKMGVELAAGLAWHPDGKRLLISYCADDSEAWIATVDAREVAAALIAVESLSSAEFTASPASLAIAAPLYAVPDGPARHPITPAAAPEPALRNASGSPATRPAMRRRIGRSTPWSRKLRFHILGIPHTASNRDYVACAYTQKVVKLCRMLKERGHTVIHYGNAASDVVCDEHVTVTTEGDLIQAYGFEQWKTKTFTFNKRDHAYQTFYKNSIAALAGRKAQNDFLLCMWGDGHRPVADAHADMIAVEPGIGYARGHFANFKVFESYAMFHAHYGAKAVERANRLNSYSVVIPNFFNIGEFDFSATKDDYFLCLGRITPGKGVHIAIQVADRMNARLVVAGQGSLADVGYRTMPRNVEVVGYADIDLRRRLMAKAKGLFLLSQYIEPFGGVQIESLLSGTPTITTDWGAFAENNLHGITGYRCRTFDHLVWAAENIGHIDPSTCRRWAEDNFSVERVGEMYEEFFQSVMDVRAGGGWYEVHGSRAALHWLVKHYPVPT